MSLMESITTNKTDLPPRLVVYGRHGVGKSSFGASAPNPVYIQTEDGLGEIDTAKFLDQAADCA